jgi:hypothetical protein
VPRPRLHLLRHHVEEEKCRIECRQGLLSTGCH